MRILRLFTVSLLMISNILFSMDVKEEMKQNIDIISHTFKVHYAPLQWKNTHLGWNIDSAVEKAKNEIEALVSPTTAAFRKIVKNFLNSTRDYHVSVSFSSTEAALLPFNVARAGNRFFVTEVLHFMLPEFNFKVEIGDELIEMDGKPIMAVYNELLHSEYDFLPNNTDKSLATNQLTMRSGEAGHTMPSDPSKVTLKFRHTNGEVATYQTFWMYIPDIIQPYIRALNATNLAKSKLSKKFKSPFLKDKMISSYSTQQAKVRKILASRVEAASTDENALDGIVDDLMQAERTRLPPLGEIIWQSSKYQYFQAAIYKLTSGQKAGFIRIHTYVPENTSNLPWILSNAFGFAQDPWDEFATIIDKFQNETDLLVIDQTRNGGGYVLYMYALASMLTDKPLKVPAHQLAITPEEVTEAIDTLQMLSEIDLERDLPSQLCEMFDLPDGSKSLLGLPLDNQLLENLKQYFEFIVSEWNAGRVLTDLGYTEGFSEIMPHPTSRYSKQIYMLIDELDFSGGDFMPAILQDNGRAILIGSNTSGAGGVVTSTHYPNRHGIMSYHYTSTFAIRPGSNQPIENLGVRPDFYYRPSIRDLRQHYVDYKLKLEEIIRLKPNNL